MAISPTFVVDIATLKQHLRLTGLETASDADIILAAAVREVRTNFIRRLGNTTVVAIVAYSSVDDPSTDNETIRALAEVTEIKWVKSVVMRALPQMSLDGSGGALQAYHNEAPFRHMGEFEKNKEIARLLSEVEENMQLLEGSDLFTSETRGHSLKIEPATQPHRPGETIYSYPD